VVGSCGHGSEPLSSIKCGEFAGLLDNCKILKEMSASRSQSTCARISNDL
jgi:hypothetical protein